MAQRQQLKKRNTMGQAGKEEDVSSSYLHRKPPTVAVIGFGDRRRHCEDTTDPVSELGLHPFGSYTLKT